MKKYIILLLLLITFPVTCPALDQFATNSVFVGDGGIQNWDSQILAVTEILHVSPAGDNSTGQTWSSAYTTIQSALDAASTASGDTTQIRVAQPGNPGTAQYDIDTTGDPSWAASVWLVGAPGKNYVKIVNGHAGAASIIKLTGKSRVDNLNFNLGSGNNNGLIMTHGGSVVNNCQFVGEDLSSTGGGIALWMDGATTIKHCRITNCSFLGHTSYFTGILLDNCTRTLVNQRTGLHDASDCIRIIGATSDLNYFRDLDIGDSQVGFRLVEGNEQHIINITFHHNTIKDVSDDVGDHTYQDLNGNFTIIKYPDNFTGVTVDASAGASAWGADTEIVPSSETTDPFRLVAVHLEPQAVDYYDVQLSADSGASHFDWLFVEGTGNPAQRETSAFPPGTENIFNTGTRISARAKTSSGGGDQILVWVELQYVRP